MAKKKQSRGDRWLNAVSKAQEALEDVENERGRFVQEVEESFRNILADPIQRLYQAMDELAEVKEEYQEWYDNMPDGLRDNSPVGEKLSVIVDLDVDPGSLSIDPDTIEMPEFEIEFIDEVRDVLSEAESADMPLGFGRD